MKGNEKPCLRWTSKWKWKFKQTYKEWKSGHKNEIGNLPFTHTHTHSLSNSLTLLHTLSHLSLSLSHTHTHTLTRSLSYSHSHTFTHSLILRVGAERIFSSRQQQQPQKRLKRDLGIKSRQLQSIRRTVTTSKNYSYQITNIKGLLNTHSGETKTGVSDAFDTVLCSSINCQTNRLQTWRCYYRICLKNGANLESIKRK